MAVPVILGLGWLATQLVTALTALITFFGTYLTRRVAIIVVAIGAFISLSAAFAAALEGLLVGITWTFPLTANIGMFLPDNLSTSVGIYLSARLAWWTFWTNWYVISVKWLV